jgi:hypothetical protein
VAVFTLRDPVARFLSAYYSRLRRGAPRYNQAWSPPERQAFEWFPNPHALVDALAAHRGREHRRARRAMRSIQHLRRPQTSWTGTPSYLRRHLDKIVYIARQETLDEDWEQLKELLGLPRGVMLPSDDVTAHRTQYPREEPLSDEGVAALRAWYADDYEVLAIAEDVRQGRVDTAARPGHRLPSLAGRSPSPRLRKSA